MSFLDKLLFRRIDSEVKWLHELRDESESWFNQLTDPILPIIQNQVDERDPEVQEKYRVIADKLLKENLIVNSGDKVKNIFHEMGGRGLPLTTSRKSLEPLLIEYLESGHFLKRLAIIFDANRTREQWHEFECLKDAVIDEINNQLRNIG
jgi:hypothetical protein